MSRMIVWWMTVTKKGRAVYHDARGRRGSSGCENCDDCDDDCFGDVGYMVFVM